MSTPPLHKILDSGFNEAGKHLPIMHEYPKMSAVAWGLLPAIGLKLGQALLRQFTPEFYNTHLQTIEKGAAYTLLGAVAVYAITHPGEIARLPETNPVYTSGVTTVLTTTTAALLQDAYRSRTNGVAALKNDADDADLVERMIGI